MDAGWAPGKRELFWGDTVDSDSDKKDIMHQGKSESSGGSSLDVVVSACSWGGTCCAHFAFYC